MEELAHVTAVTKAPATKTSDTTGRKKEPAVTRRPRYADGTDLRCDEFLVLIDGNVVGASYEADGGYYSWGVRPTGPHATREEAERAQADAVLAADRDVLRIRVDRDGTYRIQAGADVRVLGGGLTQIYLDDAARCAATVTATCDGFTLDHTTGQHAERACEHDGLIVTYRLQQAEEPTAGPALVAHRSTGRTPLPEQDAPAQAKARQHAADPGPTYEEALEEAARVGARNCTDPALMAMFCAHDIQYVAGAVAPKLVWEGARRKGMTASQLMHLAAKDALAVGGLMWA
jgi:hypothetical protein